MAIETSNISATSLTGSLYGTASYSDVSTYALGTVILNGTEVTEYSDLMQFNAAGLPITKYTNPNLKWLGTNALAGTTTLNEFDALNLKYIGNYAFSSVAGLTSFTGNLVETVGSYAFDGSGIVMVSLPEATTIKNQAFSNCTALTTFSAPKLTHLETAVFSNCNSLSSIDLSKCVDMNADPFGFGFFATNGTITISSNITSSNEWIIKVEPEFQLLTWTINYVN